MVKHLVLLVNFLIALFMNFLFQTPVQLNLNAPSSVNAGESFEMEITLDKGDLSSFSRYIQELPQGLTATPSVSSNADFTFKDQKVRLIWLRLPEETTVTFKYNVHVDQRLKGDFNLEGQFSFIDNNERKSVNKVSTMINIVPSPDLPLSQLVDIGEFENAVIPDLSPIIEGDVMCIRKAPDFSNPTEGIVINIIVDKGQQEKFAKIEEVIPNGFDAVPLVDQNAIFSVSNNLVKFLWMNLPGDEFFNISYKLIPKSSDASGDFVINGTFSYIEDDDKTVKIDIVQEDFKLTGTSSTEIEKIFDQLTNKSLPEDLLAQNETDSETELGNNEVSNVEQVVEDNSNEGTSVKAPSLLGNNSDQNSVSTNQTVKERKVNTASSIKSDLLKPEKGVYYRVQLAAGHKPVNIRRYFKKFNLEKNVKKENHDGWYKYSVGSFMLYKEARNYRNYIWRTTIIDDAFVSAYNQGQRITVQEALMIANQRWYK